MQRFVFIWLLLAVLIHRGYQEFGPFVHQTKGEIWPKPQHQERLPGYFVLRRNIFDFKVNNSSCIDLQDALKRYKYLILNISSVSYPVVDKSENRMKIESDKEFLGYIDSFDVYLTEPCSDSKVPKLDEKEDYQLSVTSSNQSLSAASLWGLYRGLETFSHIVHLHQDGETLMVNSTKIIDYPKFKYRGLMLDTARHFIPVDNIFKVLDAMAYSKLNVFHWHISDDQSFPYQSIKFPELSLEGSYHRSFQYSLTDVATVLEFARKRGIMVIPEFSTPGHTRSWGLAKPELLTQCYKNNIPSGEYGSFDPTKNSTYNFMSDFLEEIMENFVGEYIHIGGNEADYDCWKSNLDIVNFMKDNQMAGNYDQLFNMYMEKLLTITGDRRKPIVWQEAFETKAILPLSSIVQIWKALTWPDLINEVTAAGKQVILSSCWITDQVIGKGDWLFFYTCEPEVDKNAPQKQKDLLLGGEVLVFTDTISRFNINTRTFPKAAVAAEKLWSTNTSLSYIVDTAKRLEEHACRLNKRGIETSPPSGPGVCL